MKKEETEKTAEPNLKQRKEALTQLATQAEPDFKHTNQTGAIAVQVIQYLAKELGLGEESTEG